MVDEDQGVEPAEAAGPVDDADPDEVGDDPDAIGATGDEVIEEDAADRRE